MNDITKAQTYVYREGSAFFISTNERDSSAMISPPLRFMETIVWEWNCETRQRGHIVGQYGDNFDLSGHAKAIRDFSKFGEQQYGDNE